MRDGKSPRENLTLRWSRDDGRSWGDPTVIDPGPSGYASLAADSSGALHVVWERGLLPGTAVWPTSIAYARMLHSAEGGTRTHTPLGTGT